MMKIFFNTVLALILWMAPSISWSDPFRTHYLCVPSVTPNQANLEFRIRARGTCVEGENYMRIERRGDGVILILPAEVPLSPEQQADLERYRNFFGGSETK